MRTFLAVVVFLAACRNSGAQDPPPVEMPPVVESPRPIANAIVPQECLAYEQAIDEMLACQQIPAATSNAFVEAYRQTALAWRTVSPEGLAILGPTCRRATDAINRSIAACRRSLPSEARRFHRAG